ncbi:MAG TPA: MFS transporter [Candidatus Saccharimonadales bacterium]|nr:MFS transporter [Candidatus Saccharimonadales bacterium]
MNRNKWLILVLLAIAQFMVVLDSAIVTVALPAMKDALHLDQSALQWIVTSYTLAFGGFLMLGGRAADLYGRRRVLLLGVATFTLFSLAIGLAQSGALVIVLRALQGLAAALMSPAALSILLTTFNEGKDRNRALGVWSAVGAGGAAVGVLLGGVLTQYMGWEWNFFVNIPVGVIVYLGLRKFVPAHIQEESDKNLDVPGAILVTTGLIGLVYALEEAPHWGWTSFATIGTFLVSLAVLAAFIVNESKVKHPLMPLSIFKIRSISSANIMMVLIRASLMGMFFFVSLYIQEVLKFSPLLTGLSFLPMPIIIGIASTYSPRAVSKYGFKPLLITGTTLMVIGTFMLSFVGLDGTYFVNILPAFLVMALGAGVTFVAVTVAATAGVPAREAGLASGLLNTSQQMGGAFGLAVLAGVMTGATSTALTNGVNPALASIDGYRAAFLVATALTLAALLIAIFAIKAHKNTK